MPVDIVLPNLGFDSREARIVEWLKQPGDPIRKGEAIALVESDKANVELESIADGTVLEQLYAAGDVAPVGATIARVGQPGQQSAPIRAASTEQAEQAARQISPVARRVAEEHGVDLTTITGSGSGGRITRLDVEAALSTRPSMQAASGANGSHILALPKVRKAARQAEIDLGSVTASGSHGQITLDDLRRYQDQQRAKPVPQDPAATLAEGVREITISRMRQAIGQRLHQSMQDAPHFYVSGEFDLESVVLTLNRMPEPHPRINDALQYLTVLTLLRVPELNATYEGGHLYRHSSVNLAVAVALEDGLITPVIMDAQRYSLIGLATESRALIERTRSNRLRPQDLSGGTFTISNLGVVKQVDEFTAVINPPQVAILAVGTVKQRPVVIDGGLHVRHTVRLTLSGDHRVVDGMSLANFMAAFQVEVDRFSR